MKQRWKKPLSWLLTLSLILSLIPAMGVTALADEEPEKGAVTTWADLQAAFNAGGTVKLGANITASASDEALSISDEKAVTLDLNGYTIDRGLTSGTYHGYVIVVDDGELTIRDSSKEETGKITGGYNGEGNRGDSAGGGIYVGLNGTLTKHTLAAVFMLLAP